jgi:hypothetical protein
MCIWVAHRGHRGCVSESVVPGRKKSAYDPAVSHPALPSLTRLECILSHVSYAPSASSHWRRCVFVSDRVTSGCSKRHESAAKAVVWLIVITVEEAVECLLVEEVGVERVR